jgi:hypothetical protein
MSSTQQPGGVTIFHLFWAIGVLGGLGIGIAKGAAYGWIGAMLGGLVGLAIGWIVGALPMIVVALLLRFLTR